MLILNKSIAAIKSDMLSGLTVSLALVPEAVAFAFVAGVHPLVGLYAAFLVGLITSIFGGRPGMISGATGALAVVMVELVSQHGVAYLFAAVILMGLMQVLAGLLQFGRFIRMVPHPVMLGFVNGLAIVIFLAQLSQFKTADASGQLVWLSGSALYTMVFFVALTMAIVHFLPKLTKAIPSSLVAIVSVTLIARAFNIELKTVGDIANIQGAFPTLQIPAVPLSLETLSIIFPYACIFAAIGLIESLLTLQLIDEMTETRGSTRKECIGQGLANVLTGFFGGMGGCAMIGQSMININSGGTGRLSGITAALCLLCFILFAYPLIAVIPIAALIGVMFIVVMYTFEWSSFRLARKIPLSDALVILLVSVVTVFTDLAIAVVAGVIISALIFAWKTASHMTAKISDVNGARIYELHGPLFFGSVQSFIQQFSPNTDPNDVIVDFRYTRVHDHSGIEAINSLAARYISRGKVLHLLHLSPDCQKILAKAGTQVESNLSEDPNYHFAGA